jgi:hypothetical protein
MNATHAITWREANQRYLSAAIALLRETLECHVARVQGKTNGEVPFDLDSAQLALEAAGRALPSPAALDIVSTTFRLSAFERDLLLLCAGMELGSEFSAVCAAAQGNAQRTYPTFSLALAVLPDAHWSALTPAAPLRRWRLIEVQSGSTLTLSQLRIDERILHYVTGVSHMDERLSGLVQPLDEAEELVPSHRAIADQLAAAWSRSPSRLPVVQLCGRHGADTRAIAAAACTAVGLQGNVLPSDILPLAAGECDALIRLWDREAALNARALFLDCEAAEHSDAAREHAITRFIETVAGPLIVATREPRAIRQRSVFRVDVRKPTRCEQRGLWQETLGESVPGLNGRLDSLVSQFDLSVQGIRTVSLLTTSTDDVWEMCRSQARSRLDELAQRIDAAAGWEDLVLPKLQRDVLQDIVTQVHQRAKVYEQWGFASNGTRGLGISVLFSGVSGTGKTMAAEVLANELQLDLYRIDLSQVVSKYIGETEKNLRRVFDAAEEGGAILLFDEADALFGKRSDVKDSHDRYANIEVSYLLQRMEAYRGLAILTTNRKDSLDPAFLRRLRFVLQFPFPSAIERARIWRTVFPNTTPIENVDADKLARLNVTGGNIRNIALQAAFLAADAGEPIRMPHLLRAAQNEYVKLEKSLTEAEIIGWIS